MKAKQASDSPVAAAAEAAGVLAPELATLLGISEPAAWDLLTHTDELSMCLSLRQLLRLSARLRVPAWSLLPEPPAPRREHHSLAHLAAEVSAYCAAHQISIEQFGDLAGWDVQHFIATPDSALDDWCLDTLTAICHTLGLHWPDYLPE
jgi:hypothetical protein